MSSDKKDKTSRRELGVLEGKITRGKLKGKPFKIRLGASPAETQITAGGQVLMCTKMNIEMDVEKQVNLVSFEVWLLPEDN